MRHSLPSNQRTVGVSFLAAYLAVGGIFTLLPLVFARTDTWAHMAKPEWLLRPIVGALLLFGADRLWRRRRIGWLIAIVTLASSSLWRLLQFQTWDAATLFPIVGLLVAALVRREITDSR